MRSTRSTSREKPGDEPGAFGPQFGERRSRSGERRPYEHTEGFVPKADLTTQLASARQLAADAQAENETWKGQLKTQEGQIADLHQSVAAQKDTIEELKALVKQSIATPTKTTATGEPYELTSSHASRSMRAAFNLSPEGKDAEVTDTPPLGVKKRKRFWLPPKKDLLSAGWSFRRGSADFKNG